MNVDVWLVSECTALKFLCVSFLIPGFKEQIYDVYRYLPPATQVVLISATLPHEILEMTNKFMTDPIRILVKRWGCPLSQERLKHSVVVSGFQFSSVAESCPTLGDPMDCSTPGFPVHHQLLDLAQTHVHRVGDAIQPSHLLLSPSAFSLSQHQGLFQWVSSLPQVAKVLEL